MGVRGDAVKSTRSKVKSYTWTKLVTEVPDERVEACLVKV